jgi:hypothetical protein
MFKLRVLAAAGLAALLPMAALAQNKGWAVARHDADRHIDVSYNGQPVTSYVWPTTLKKPVLYPLRAPDGQVLSRGYPLEPRPGERVDHPHHAGMWFNYGNVNGFDFWNNSDAIKPEDREKMGSVRQDRIVSASATRDHAEIVTETTWVDGKGEELLRDHTRLVFHRTANANVIDRETTLTALQPVVFHDDKEGMLGIRVAHFLESPTEKGGMFADASGRVTKVADADTSGATGVYLTSAGKQGDAAWGTRGTWCTLTGQTDGKTYTIAILDHPGNPDYPTYWHARGYGLFAANPLGDSIFDPKAPKHNFAIEQGKSATFRYRVLLADGGIPAADANRDQQEYAGTR